MLLVDVGAHVGFQLEYGKVDDVEAIAGSRAGSYWNEDVAGRRRAEEGLSWEVESPLLDVGPVRVS